MFRHFVRRFAKMASEPHVQPLSAEKLAMRRTEIVSQLTEVRERVRRATEARTPFEVLFRAIRPMNRPLIARDDFLDIRIPA